MMAAAITRRLNVDPLIRTNGGGAGGISATGTADSGPNKVSHSSQHLGCHGAFGAITSAGSENCDYSASSPFTRQTSSGWRIQPAFFLVLDSIQVVLPAVGPSRSFSRSTSACPKS